MFVIHYPSQLKRQPVFDIFQPIQHIIDWHCKAASVIQRRKKYRGCAGNVVDRCRETTGLFYLSIFSKNILMFTFFNNAISFDGSKNCSQQLLTLVMGQAISIVVGPAIFLLNGPQHSTFCMLRLSLCMLFRVKTNSDIFILYVWKI